MRINIIADSDGDYGMGHIVRQHRLAQVLRQRGATVGFYLDQEAKRGRKLVEEFTLSTWPDTEMRYCDAIIVDRPANDDVELEYLRKFCHKLIVFVGVGEAITPDTYWIADYVIWQNIVEYHSFPNIFSDKVRQGQDWLILSPSLRDVELPKEREGVATYFGGGVGRENFLDAIPEKEEYALGGVGYWKDDIGQSLLKSRAFFGTMGMVAYEAMAAGLRPLVVSRSNDHKRTAAKLQNNSIAYDMGLARNWNAAEAERATEILSWPTKDRLISDYQRPDGWGAWRIANLILNG